MLNTTKKNGRKTAAVKINPQRYGRLLARVLPVRIETEEENDRMLREVRKLIEKGHVHESLLPYDAVRRDRHQWSGDTSDLSP